MMSEKLLRKGRRVAVSWDLGFFDKLPVPLPGSNTLSTVKGKLWR
jgi:hypothetical protein